MLRFRVGFRVGLIRVRPLRPKAGAGRGFMACVYLRLGLRVSVRGAARVHVGVSFGAWFAGKVGVSFRLGLGLGFRLGLGLG